MEPTGSPPGKAGFKGTHWKRAGDGGKKNRSSLRLAPVEKQMLPPFLFMSDGKATKGQKIF